MDFKAINFKLPKNQSNEIKVIGLGGGGGNTVQHMVQTGCKGVDFVICNTDKQALENSSVPVKIQLGTSGLGAGGDPEIAKELTEGSLSEIEDILKTKTEMLFLTAGMGGGTGTGASPIVAKKAKEMGIMVVAVVTTPFVYEGPKRLKNAQKGLEELRKYVDSCIVINNNSLIKEYPDMGITSGFVSCNEVLATGVMTITRVITEHYTMNIDLQDARKVLEKSGTAIMGRGFSEGEHRAKDAIVQALESPLLDDNKITGAKEALLLVTWEHKEATQNEMEIITNCINEYAEKQINIILGMGADKKLNEGLSVTVVVTGFPSKNEKFKLEDGVQEETRIVDGQEEVVYNFPTENTKIKPKKKDNKIPYQPEINFNENQTEMSPLNTEVSELKTIKNKIKI